MCLFVKTSKQFSYVLHDDVPLSVSSSHYPANIEKSQETVAMSSVYMKYIPRVCK